MEIDEKKISISEHNKVVEYHIKQWRDAEERLEALRINLLGQMASKTEELREQLDRKTQEYELNTPMRIRKLNAELQSKIYDLEDIIADKDDLIELLREEIKNNKSLIEVEKKQLQEKIESKDDTISDLREQIKKKNALIKKYSNKK